MHCVLSWLLLLVNKTLTFILVHSLGAFVPCLLQVQNIPIGCVPIQAGKRLLVGLFGRRIEDLLVIK